MDTSKEASVSIREKTLKRPVEESLEIESEHKKQVVDESLNITRLTDHKPRITSTPANPKNQSALNKSLKEIEEWNYKLPVFKDDKKPTNGKGKKRVLRSSIQKAKVKADWKLKSIPKVVIDKITIEDPKREHFESSINIPLDEFEKFYKSVIENSLPPIVESYCRSEDGCVHDSRFITKRVLRKRSKTMHVDSLSISNKKSKAGDNCSQNKTFKPVTSTPYVNKEGQRILRKRSLTVNLSSNLCQDLSGLKILRSGRIIGIIDNSSTASNISKTKSENAKKKSKSSKYQFDDSSNISNNLTDLSATKKSETKSYLSPAKSMSCLEAISAIEKPQKMRKTHQNSTDNSHSMRTRSRQIVNSPPKQRLRRSKSVYLDTSELSQKKNSNSRNTDLPSSSNTSQMPEKQKKLYFLRTQSMYNLQDISSTEKTQNTCKTDVASCENSRDSFNTSPICGRSRSVNRDPRKHSSSFSNQRLTRSKSLILNRPETCDYSDASLRRSKSFNIDTTQCDYSSISMVMRSGRVLPNTLVNSEGLRDIIGISDSNLTDSNIVKDSFNNIEKTDSFGLRGKSMNCLQDISNTEDIWDMCNSEVASYRDSSFKTQPIRRRPCSTNYETRKRTSLKPRLRRSKSFYIDTTQCDYSSTSMVMRSGRVLPNTLVNSEGLRDIIGISDSNLTDSNIVKDSFNNIEKTDSFGLRGKSMNCLQDISNTEDIWDMCNSEVASHRDSSFKTQPIHRRPCSTNYETRKRTSLKPRLRRSKSFNIDKTQCDYSSTSMVMRSGRVLPNTLVNSEGLRDIIGISNLTDSNIVKDSFNNIERNSFSAIEKEQSYSIKNSNRQNSFHGQNNTCSSQVQNSISNDAVSDIDKTNETNTLTGKHITVRRIVHLEKFPNICVDFHKSTDDSNIANGDQTNFDKNQNGTRSSENPNCSSKSISDCESGEHFVGSELSIDSASITKETKNTSIASVNGYQSNLGQSKNCTQSSENLSDFSKSIFDYDTDEDLLSDTDVLDISTSTLKRAEDISIGSLKNIKIVDVCSLKKDKVNLKTGKDWRRSLAYWKKSMLLSACQSVVCIETNNCACAKCIHIKLLDQSVCRKSVRVVLDGTPQRENRRISLIETYANATAKGYVPENFVREVALGKLLEDLSARTNQNVTRHHREGDATTEFFVSAKDTVLGICHQTEVVPFEECYPPSVLKNCHKIGEGVYGEVFLFINKTGSTSVMKVIPIEGDLVVNGERQKKYEEILSEIVIAMELSDLRSNKKNNTSGFSEVRNVHFVQGKYPEHLLDLWNLYYEDRGSENECPEVFDEKQLYIILELANGGKDLDSFVFANAKQAYSLFKQAACSLAVAEVELQFEHRDLHWGNILISPMDENNEETYVINGREIRVPSNGVQISIIDFTLSRINFDGVCIYNDLSVDPDLFKADGDYQFEIYRLMQKRNNNNWQAFEPYTNILWLHYILDKMIYGLWYNPPLPKFHQVYIDKMKELKDQILEYKSVEEFVTHNYV